MSEHLDRLGRLLEAIGLAIDAVRAEVDLAQREQWLEVVDRAFVAASTEYEAVVVEARRPVLRVIRGGAAADRTPGPAAWLRQATGVIRKRA